MVGFVSTHFDPSQAILTRDPPTQQALVVAGFVELWDSLLEQAVLPRGPPPTWAFSTAVEHGRAEMLRALKRDGAIFKWAEGTLPEIISVDIDLISLR